MPVVLFLLRPSKALHFGHLGQNEIVLIEANVFLL
jgi:hypothetical protein